METWTKPDFAHYQIWVTGILMLISGLLMNGAGLGGGGVYVTLLITVMGMSGHEAVPNSKMIVFISAIVTYYLNTVRKHKAELIDFSIVGAIVPLSLAGTSVGVLVNTVASESVLLILLCCLMAALVVVSVTVAVRKIRNKDMNILVEEPQEPEVVSPPAKPSDLKYHFRLFALLVIVIVCGILTNHPAISPPVKWTFFSISITASISAGIWFYAREDQKLPLAYPLVGFVGGVCSGLFGVGGGMIFAPFLLHMKLDPETAVAVSSTCVLFASASSSMQYLFIGKVAVLIALFLSLFAIPSAIAATYISRSLARITKRPYLLHVIVAGAVIVSAGVTLVDTIIRLSN